jgi:hypothetical protein
MVRYLTDADVHAHVTGPAELYTYFRELQAPNVLSS